jgi:lantibiotic modifying enzyme
MSTATTQQSSLFFDAAWNIGIDLVRDALWDDNKHCCTWTGNWMDPVEGKFASVVKSFGNDLYAGTSGIAFFLSALHSVKQDQLLSETIEGAVNHTLLLADGTPHFGFYSGKPGIASALIFCGEQMNRKDWIAHGIALLETLKDAEPAVHETDIISGIAGTIPCLVVFAGRYKRPELLQTATRLGHTLYNNATRTEQGWSWLTIPGTNHLTGYSHGTSGIALSLLQLYKATGEDKFLEAVEGGFSYEHTHFNHAKQNWPDFRDNFPKGADGTYNCGMAWCHGAPGIALSRVRANELKTDNEYQRVATIALDTTYRDLQNLLSNPAYRINYSLCHGVAGNADILLNSGRPQDKALAEATGMAGIQQYDDTMLPWPSGTTDAKPTPGLMMGAAGTGYFYLRLSDPARFGTILLPEV